MVVSAQLASFHSFLFLLIVFPSKCFSSCPCVKTVLDSPGLDGTYLLLEEIDQTDTVCPDQCIYYRDGAPQTVQYCFKEESDSEGAEVMESDTCPVTGGTGVTATTGSPLQQKCNSLDLKQTYVKTEYEASATFCDNIDAVEANLVSLTASGRRKREESGNNIITTALLVPSDCATVVSCTQNIQLTDSSTAEDLVAVVQYLEPLAHIDVTDITCTVAEKNQLTTMINNFANMRTYVEAITLSIKMEICDLIIAITGCNSLLQEDGYPTVTIILPVCDISTEAPEMTMQTQFTTTPPYNE